MSSPAVHTPITRGGNRSPSFGSSTSPTERNEKLGIFLKDCLFMGCLTGFSYFDLYSRGREELLVTVKTSLFPPLPFFDPSPENVTNFGKPLSTMESGLPPASPCAKDAEQLSQDSVFLIGGYARYKCPFVWLRSNHSKLLAPSSAPSSPLASKSPSSSKDTPLELSTTAKWATSTVKVWDVVEELVNSSMVPPPTNPFKIDFNKLEALPLVQKSLVAGSLVLFLKKIFMKDPPYSELVFQDIQKLLDVHFSTMSLVAVEHSAVS